MNNEQKGFLRALGLISFCLLNMALLIHSLATGDDRYGLASIGLVTLALFGVFKSLGIKK